MTREEELDWLYRLRSEIYVYMPKEWIIPMENALDMAIKALEQEPCEDAISRQAVLDLLEDTNNGWIINEVSQLPSVKPQEKTGHWQHYEGMLICSECGTEFYDDIMEYCGDDVPKCCPDCGCRMVEPQERSEE